MEQRVTTPAEGSRRSGGRLVVGYDGSTDADRGLDWAVEHARRTGLRIEVVAAYGDLPYLPDRVAGDSRPLVERWLARAEQRLNSAAVPDWRATAVEAKAVAALLEASQEAALLVVGAQGHGFLGGMVLGSVSQHVTRHAACPVVVVRPARAAGRNRVVVGVDGSEGSIAALRFAFEYAADAGSTVVAAHGRNLHAVAGPWAVDIDPSVAEELQSMEQMLAAALEGPRKAHPGVPVELLALPVAPVRALADASAVADLLVVGTRGLGGFLGLLLGSVSSGVLQDAQCPVAVVR